MRNSNARKIDVVVVLGGGIAADGILSSATKERLNDFLKKREKLPQVPIVLSGQWGGFIKMEPHTTEAQEMEKYLITHGIGARQVVKEEESLDTISNAVFMKKIIERHHDWKKILLVTSDWHMERALWIFQKILGKDYRVMPLLVILEETEKKQRGDYEKYLLGVAKRFLKSVPTDSKGLIDLLSAEHPFYSKSEKAQELLKEIASHKR